MTYYIGIDPSVTCTGMIVLGDGEVNDYRIKPHKVLIPGWKSTVSRYLDIAKRIMETLDLFDGADKRILLEDYAPRYMSTAIPQIELGAHIRAGLQVHCYKYPETSVEFISPKELKKFATGKGNASKIEVATAIARRFGVDYKGDDNLYDAYGLARMLMAADGRYDNLNLGMIEVVKKAINRKREGK